MTKLFNSKTSGFSLLATVMMIVVLSLLMLVGITLYKSYDEQRRLEITSKNMELVEEALKNYVSTYGHLPCPASQEASLDTPAFGTPVSAACPAGAIAGTDYDAARNVRIGAVPVRALDLSDAVMLDGWKNRMVYAVTASFARAGADMDSPDGGITINDINANSATLTPDTVIYALLSPGSDRRGAYTLNGVQYAPCDTSIAGGENCDGDAIFTTTLSRADADSPAAFTSKINFMASLLSYDWASGAWSACSGVCGSGTQTRTVVCQDSRGNPAPDARCTGPKPAASQSCPLGACTWTPSSWGPCTTSCPSGTSTRIRTASVCRSPSGDVVSSSYCSGAAPAPATESCTNPVTCAQMQPTRSPCGEHCQSTINHTPQVTRDGIVVSCASHESWVICMPAFSNQNVSCVYVDGAAGAVVCTPN